MMRSVSAPLWRRSHSHTAATMKPMSRLRLSLSPQSLLQCQPHPHPHPNLSTPTMTMTTITRATTAPTLTFASRDTFLVPIAHTPTSLHSFLSPSLRSLPLNTRWQQYGTASSISRFSTSSTPSPSSSSSVRSSSASSSSSTSAFPRSQPQPQSLSLGCVDSSLPH